ncbi:MAG: hypothetical protein ACKOTE_17695, partial [Opitutaceae bacterium]
RPPPPRPTPLAAASAYDLYTRHLHPPEDFAAQGAFLIDSQAQLAGTPSLLFPRGAAAPGR